MNGDGYLPHDRPTALRAAVLRLHKALGPHRHEFNSIVVRGLSGIVPGAIVANKWRKNLVVVRKEREGSHGKSVEGTFVPPYVIIDDFMSTGDTIGRILYKLEMFEDPVYVALYAGHAATTRTFGIHDDAEYRIRTMTIVRKKKYLYTLEAQR